MSDWEALEAEQREAQWQEWRKAWPAKLQAEIEDRLRELSEIVEPEQVVIYVERLAARMRDQLEP